MNWYTSDHHFGHANIIKYQNRPFVDTAHMNAQMFQRWNAVVQPEDTVYYVGDFALKLTAEEISGLLSVLNGRKILIRGNHDDKLFRPARWKTLGFAEVHKRLPIFIGPHAVFLDHYPPPYGNEQFTIHGHVHGAWRTKHHAYNVSVEVHDYTPVPEETIKAFFDSLLLTPPHAKIIP